MDKKTILIVDDEEMIRSELAEFLAYLGYATFAAEGHEKALSILAKEHVDFMLVDFKMPGMNGIDLLRLVKKEHPGIIVLFITGDGDDAVITQAMVQGASAFFIKPVSGREIDAVIKKITNS
ncbi:MAG: response regulator [Spirochaetes bacterium]|nr:response regulator [Spirochaetota bacterium]